MQLFKCKSSISVGEAAEALKTVLPRGCSQLVGTVTMASVWWMNSGDAQQIALRHSGELVKEAAEKDNGSLSLYCLLKGSDTRTKYCSESRRAPNTISAGAFCALKVISKVAKLGQRQRYLDISEAVKKLEVAGEVWCYYFFFFNRPKQFPVVSETCFRHCAL